MQKVGIERPAVACASGDLHRAVEVPFSSRSVNINIGEVVVERRLADAHLARQSLHPQAVRSLRGEQFARFDQGSSFLETMPGKNNPFTILKF